MTDGFLLFSFSNMNTFKRVQYAGSLFVDKFEKVAGAHFVKPVAPILVLNGNIGKLTSFQTHAFLRHCSGLWDAIVYVPGAYEQTSRLIDIDIPNVYFLNRRTVKLKGVYFSGCAYTSLEDHMWIRDEFYKLNISGGHNKKIVAATYGIPCVSMAHSRDLPIKLTHVDEFYPCFNAWISGYTRGAKTHVYNNGVIGAYNARGPIDGLNDFDGSCGWRRDAF